ncbi:hypothetical protein JKP88DRAFT_204997 [Tribonema minus]|uniref:ubiquitinyl hydrolase 1 n=1 Tax=Tribonema minus TaxID=303371 RepID=A0A836CLU3_9STRA|nr:hypothetical protein JKP88DRAFT_204997 [Tribonema minus]
MEPDGNCLYRAVSDQIYGNCDNHLYVRKACVDHMSAHRTRFGTFVAGDFAAYLRRARQPGVWGDDLEIRALEEVFDRPVRIYAAEDPRARPMKMDFEHALEGGGEGGAGGGGGGRRVAPITLSYHGHSHYNSVRDARLVYPLQPRQSQVRGGGGARMRARGSIGVPIDMTRFFRGVAGQCGTSGLWFCTAEWWVVYCVLFSYGGVMGSE